MTETGILYPAVRSVKLFVGDDIRRFAFVGHSLEHLREQLRTILNQPLDVPLRYQDDEGDWISICTDAELHHAFELSGSKALRMKMDPIVSSTIVSPIEPAIVPAIVPTAPPAIMSKSDYKNAKRELKEQARQAKMERKLSEKEVKKQTKDEWRAAKGHRKEWKEAKEKNSFVARFVKHVTVEDNYEYVGGTAFVKTWRFRNEGTIAWPEHSILLFVGKKGDQMGAPSSVVLDRSVAPDEEIDVSVGMVAPLEPGTYSGYWRLAEPSGRKFGQRVRVLIKVAGSSSSSDESPSAWSEMLNKLEGMGFKDKALNVKLLVKTQGNLDKVIHRLLKREQKMSGVKGKQ